MKYTTILTALLVAFACGKPSSDETHSVGVASATPAALAPSSSAPAAPPSSHAAMEGDDDVPAEKFAGGAKAFNEVRQALLESYYAEGLTEDDLYRAATAGMLEKLEPRMKKYNRLLAPREVAELKNDLKGEVVGIGVHIQFDEKSGYTDVLGTIPGSPSEKAGLVPGDKIVSIDHKLYKGMRMKDVVVDIRGKPGEPVTLSVLRDDKLLSFTLVRDRVAYDIPAKVMLPENVGYVRIPSFTDRTPGSTRAALEELERGGARALVLDLRHSPGGSFERALETAGLFLPEGTPVVVLKRRSKPEEPHVAKGTPVLGSIPLVVLVDSNTASGAEFLAGALREARHARLVGARTFGKWSVQSLDDLPNGYAYKYTVSMFYTPSGKTYEGTGLTPDVEVTMDETILGRANAAEGEERLALDAQLRTARELVLRAP